jgi:hypothetical protein
MLPTGRSLTRPTLRRWVAAAALAVTLFSGCGSEQPSNVVPEASPSPVTATRDGLVVTLSVDRSTLPAAARTWVSVSVVNTSSEVRLWRGGGCNILADVSISTATGVTPEHGRNLGGPAGTFKDLAAPSAPESNVGWFTEERFVDKTNFGCPANLAINQIGAGQRLEVRAAWDGEIQDAVAPPGPARIVASFPYLGRAGKLDSPEPIEAMTMVDVMDRGVRLLSRGQAADAALSNPDFDAWVTSNNIAAWSGVEVESHAHVYVFVVKLATLEGRATVDRQTGAVSFDTRVRQ